MREKLERNKGFERNGEREWFQRRSIQVAPYDPRQGPYLRRQDRHQQQQQESNETSFYFTNFPDEFGREKLRSVFEVFIPKRKDKNGNQFGFVRFVDVSNAKELEDRLNWILIRNQKLFVNVLRYSRGGKKQGAVPRDGPRRWKSGQGTRNEASGTHKESRQQPSHYNKRGNQINQKQHQGWSGMK